MTSLDKPDAKKVVRKTRARVPHGVKDQIVITLYPGGLIGLREHRRRKEYTLEVGALYLRAVRAEVETKRREKR